MNTKNKTKTLEEPTKTKISQLNLPSILYFITYEFY